MRASLRLPLLCLATALLAPEAHAVAGPWFETPESKVRLVSRYATARAGGDAGLGLDFRLAPGWHVYWKNAGDAGYPPQLESKSPALETPTLRYPAPSRFELPGDLVAFGYEGEALYPINAALAPATRESAALAAELDYLICAESCIPYRAMLALDLPVGAERVDDPATAPLVAAARARLPAPAPAGVRSALSAGEGGEWTLELTFAVPGIRAAAPDLFFEPHAELVTGRPALFAAATGPGFRVPVKAIDPTRPPPERVRLAWTAIGFERDEAPLAWEGVIELPAPRQVRSAPPLVPVAGALAALATIWIILARARRTRLRAATSTD